MVELAQKEAVDLRHNHIGTEHLLLGLLGEGEGVAGGVLRSAGVTLDDVRARVRGRVGPGPPGADDADALRAIGIDIDRVRASVEGSFGPGGVDLGGPPAPAPEHSLPPSAGPAGTGPLAAPPWLCPLHPPQQTGAGVVAAGGAAPPPQPHRHRAHPPGTAPGRPGLAAELLADGGLDLPELRRQTLSALGQVA